MYIIQVMKHKMHCFTLCLGRNWEYQQNEESVVGKLCESVEFWSNELNASPFVTGMIKNGYRLPISKSVPPFYAKNNASSLKHKDFASESINELLKSGCIEEVFEMPFCCNPLTVAVKNGKSRLVIDLRHVNDYLDFPKFKYEDLKIARQYLEKDDFFTTFDLKSGYHHIFIHVEDKKYLGFAWQFPDMKIRYFQFRVLPFGLASACYAFTKLTKPLVKKWRKQSIRITMYLDDGLSSASNFLLALKHAKIIQSDLDKAGLTVNWKKSNFIPSRNGKWLGFIIDTEALKFYVPQAKIDRVLQLLDIILSVSHTSARMISKIAGNIISMQIAIGPLTRLFTRQMYRFIENRYSWDQNMFIDTNLKKELVFWKSNLNHSNGFEIKVNHAVSKIVYSDASGSGYGGFVVQKLGNLIAKGTFSPHEKSTSSTCRELLAVKNVLLSVATELQNDTVQWFSDNTNVARIIEVGSGKPWLQEIALDIFHICIKFNIKLIPSWIPRENNTIADELSKSKDTDNWGIDFETFNYIQFKFGRFTVDRFADSSNRKVKNFNSKYFCPGSFGVNAFTFDWSNHFNWLCPPIYLIGSTLSHARLCKAEGVLLVPMWESSYFWPLLTKNGIFNDFVKDFLLLDPFYLNFSSSEKCAFEGFVNFSSLALLIKF